MTEEPISGAIQPPAPADASPAAPASYIDEYDAEGTPTVNKPAEPAAAAPPLPRNPDGTFARRDGEHRQASRWLVDTARDLGVSDEEIASTTPDALEVAVYHLSKQRLGRQREGSIEQTVHQSTDRNLGQQAGGGSPAGSMGSVSNTHAQPEAASPPAEQPYSLDLNEAEYDPALIAAIKKMGAAHSKEIKALKGEIAQLRQVEQIRANESFTQKMDRLFAGDETTFGKGEGHTLTEDSAELARRRAVLGVMQGQKAGTIEQKYEKAYQMLYGTRQAAAPVVDELAARQEEWRRGNVARPTQRNGAAEPPGTAKAERSVAAKIAEQNGAPESGEADASDFL